MVMMVDRLDALLAEVPRVDGQPRAMIKLARQMSSAGHRRRGYDLVERAMALTDDAETTSLGQEWLSESVHPWHFNIVRDHIRNAAYAEALRRAIRPGSKLLEIGTGTGLLAMIAARAGARVVTCEADPVIAATARKIIAANGLADQITVINKHSTDLDVDRDMGGLADILVSEIISSDLVSEYVLSAHEHAIAHLIAPGATIIPARGHVRVALAEFAQADRWRMAEVEGFDLSLFNPLAPSTCEISVGHRDLMLRSAPASLFEFDFASGGPWGPSTTEVALHSNGGAVNGIVQWIALDMDDTHRFENHPMIGATSSWAAMFTPIADTIETQAGDAMTIAASLGRDAFRMWLKN